MKTPENEELANLLNNRDWRDLSDLRTSLKEHGWINEAPAFVDEDGVVLNGNTRLALAKELGIEPVIKMVHLGQGEEADARRLALSIGLNMGQNSLTPNDRKRIAEHLYTKKGWTMERVGEALNVDKATISRDLSNCCTLQQLKPAKTDANPKGAGRPKGSTKADKPSRKTPPTPVKDKIVALNEQGVPPEAIVSEVGCHPRTVQRVLDIEHEKQEVANQNKELEVALSQSAQKRLEYAIQQETKRLEAAFKQRVVDETERRLEEFILPRLREREAECIKTLQRRKGLIDKATYIKILRTLHPDFNTDPDKKPQCDEAFNLFRNLKTALLSEKDDPTPAPQVPRNAAEMMEWARKAREAKAKAKHNQASSLH